MKSFRSLGSRSHAHTFPNLSGSTHEHCFCFRGISIRCWLCLHRDQIFKPDICPHQFLLCAQLSDRNRRQQFNQTLDKPDVLLVIGSIKFAVNIMLDLILISKVHVKGFKPTVSTQATIQLICNMCSAVAGLMYFISVTSKRHRQHVDRKAIKTQP